MATLRDLLIRDKASILYHLAGGACQCTQGITYPYYVGDGLYFNTFHSQETRALAATPEYQEIILGIVPGQRYECVDKVCTPQANGVYTESTCAGACKKASSGSNTGIIIIGAGLLGLVFAFMKGRK